MAAGVSGLAYTPAISSVVDGDPAVFDAYREVRWGAEGGAVVWRGGGAVEATNALALSTVRRRTDVGMYIVVCRVVTDLEC